MLVVEEGAAGVLFMEILLAGTAEAALVVIALVGQEQPIPVVVGVEVGIISVTALVAVLVGQVLL